MSSLTECNYCTLKRMQERAKEGKVDIIMDRADGWITVRYSNEEEPSAYFLELSDHCVC